MAKLSKIYNLKVNYDISILYDIYQLKGDVVRVNEMAVSCEQNLDTDPDVYEEGLLSSMLEGIIFGAWKMLLQYLDHPNMMDKKETLERIIRSMLATSSLTGSFSVDGEVIKVIKEGSLLS